MLFSFQVTMEMGLMTSLCSLPAISLKTPWRTTSMSWTTYSGVRANSKTLSELATLQVNVTNSSTTKHCRYIVGTLDLMVAENYVIVYLCAMAQRDKLPGIGWLRECYTTVDRRLVLFTQIGLVCGPISENYMPQ